MGSVIAVAAPGATTINIYDPFGVPAAGNLGRLQYDSYPWMAEAGLHHLRARAYFPAPGR
jgi:hypothetical protein